MYRGALVALCARDLGGKYKQSLLGIAWAVVQPVVQVGVFTFVFAGVAKLEVPVPYPIFVLSALLPFNLFQQVITMGTPAFVNAQGIVTKVYFPRMYTTIAATSSAAVSAAVTLFLLVIAMLYYRAAISPSIWLVVPTLLGVLLLSFGIASLLSALNARFRDVQHALPLLMTVLLFVSPVLYPLASVPDRLRALALLNPVTGLVEGFRAGVIGTAPYSWLLICASLGTSLAVFLVGVTFFERTQAKLIDVL
jgi:lipopolysaccharide transport system permease protein